VKTSRVSGTIHLARIIAFIVLTAGGSYAHAQEENECGTRAQQIVAQVYPEARTVTEDTLLINGATISLPTSKSLFGSPHTMVCKQWPADPSKLLVAVPLIREGDSVVYNTGDLDILVLDNDTLRVLQRLHEKDLMSDDNISITRVSFDTARYRLAPDKTAFGVRIDSRSSSRVDPYYGSTLRLYLPERDQLKPVLDNIVVEENSREWDGMCAGESHKTKRTLLITPDIHHDLASITVKEATESSITQEMPDNRCKESDFHKTTRKTTLIYKGDMYSVPSRMKQN